MAIELERGPFGAPLRKCCIFISAFLLISIVLNVVLHFTSSVISVLGLTLTIIANVALLLGALKNHKWLVLLWLVIQILYFINWPIAFFGILFNFGGYRNDASSTNVIVALIFHVIDLVINVYCTLIVWSFHKELRNASPQLSSVPTV